MKVLSLATEISYFVHSETYVLENFYQKTIRQKLVLLYLTHSGTATVVLSILTASPMTIYLFTFTNSDTCTSHCEHFPYNHIFRTQLNTGADPAFWFGRGTGRMEVPQRGPEEEPQWGLGWSHQKPEQCYIVRLKNHLQREKRPEVRTDWHCMIIS